MLCCNERIIKGLINCIRLGSFDVVLFITCTAILSECNTTVQFFKEGTHNSNTMTIGKNSLTEMWYFNHSGAQSG